MSSQRQQIVTALKTRLETIQAGLTVTSGGEAYTYATDIGSHVTVWRREELRSDESWFINIRDLKNPSDRTGDGAEVGRPLHRLGVTLDIGVRDDLAPELVRSALLDVCACIGVDPRLGGLCRWIDIEEDSLDVAEIGQIIAGASLQLTITYRTPLWRT